jgi:hypothetical protein
VSRPPATIRCGSCPRNRRPRHRRDPKACCSSPAQRGPGIVCAQEIDHPLQVLAVLGDLVTECEHDKEG